MKTVDLEENFTKWGLSIKSQNPRGMCSVFTVTAGMEYALSRQQDKGIRLSEEFLNWAANVSSKHISDGQCFWGCENGYDAFGICEEKYMPYVQKFYTEHVPSEAALENARGIKKRGMILHWIKRLGAPQGATPDEIAAMKAVIDNGWPVCAGSFHSLLFTGYVDDPALPGGGQFLLHDSAKVAPDIMTYELAGTRLNDMLWIEAPER